MQGGVDSTIAYTTPSGVIFIHKKHAHAFRIFASRRHSLPLSVSLCPRVTLQPKRLNLARFGPDNGFVRRGFKMCADVGFDGFHPGQTLNVKHTLPLPALALKVTVPRLFADLGAERVKEKNDLSSLKARVDPFPRIFSQHRTPAGQQLTPASARLGAGDRRLRQTRFYLPAPEVWIRNAAIFH